MFYLNFFVSGDALRPSQQFFSNFSVILDEPELGSEDIMSSSRTQQSASGEAQTSDLSISISSHTLSNFAPLDYLNDFIRII